MSHEDLEELRRAIELKLKLGKLDSLLLFVPTLLGLAFSLIQYSTGMIRQMTDALALVPVLLLGIGVPVYIGYYRGGIKVDSITERARGWIYLITGVYGYALPSTTAFLSKYLPISYGIAGLILSFLTSALVVYMAVRIGRGVLSLTGRHPSKEDLHSFRMTAIAAFLLLLSSKDMTDLLASTQSKVTPLVTVGRVAISVMFFHFAVVAELYARGSIGERLRSRTTALKCTLTILGSVSLLLATASLENLELSPYSSAALGITQALLLAVYIILTVILLRKEIHRSSIAKRSQEQQKKEGGSSQHG